MGEDSVDSIKSSLHVLARRDNLEEMISLQIISCQKFTFIPTFERDNLQRCVCYYNEKSVSEVCNEIKLELLVNKLRKGCSRLKLTIDFRGAPAYDHVK